METEVIANIMLAQAVLVEKNKLHILGGGCDRFKQGDSQAIGVLVQAPWSRDIQRFRWDLSLFDADGNRVTARMGGKRGPVTVEDEIAIRPEPELLPGSRIKVAFQVSLGPAPFETGRYVWQFSIDGVQKEEWMLPFSLAAASPDLS
jgi:hypothetical protein